MRTRFEEAVVGVAGGGGGLEDMDTGDLGFFMADTASMYAVKRNQDSRKRTFAGVDHRKRVTKTRFWVTHLVWFKLRTDGPSVCAFF
jgi:hypothetical protein